MAKISDLVKTYRMLSDPNAPDWNVKFVGALATGIFLIAATAAGIYWSVHHEGGLADERLAAETRTEGDGAAEPCPAPTAPTPTATPPECLDMPPAVLP